MRNLFSGIAFLLCLVSTPISSTLNQISVPNLTIMDDVNLQILGYIDMGYFVPSGDGVAYILDPTSTASSTFHQDHPNLPTPAWVFSGDPWSNPINTQGDSADLGLDRTNIPRFDPIRSGGNSAFIVNIINLGMKASVKEWLLMETSVNFEPRQGYLGSHGDLLSADLAYLELKPFSTWDLHFFAGKFESTFGIEYRRRKAPDHFGITPSLISRYTTGTPVGIKVRGSFLDELLGYNIALTNGSMFVEKFSPFSEDIDRNQFKTVSGRLSLKHKFDGPMAIEAELGGSGVYGAGDAQPRNDAPQWQAGGDLRLKIEDFELRAEFLKTFAESNPVNTKSYYLDSMGSYGEASYQILAWLGAMARVDWRKAQFLSEGQNLYISNIIRTTLGLHFDITYNLIAKAEYLIISQLEGPQIPANVFTSSLVFRF